MRRVAALVVVLLGALPAAQALQLGELRIDSDAGEPLRARISLPGAERVDLQAATVTLAADRIQAAAGINPDRLPPSLSLTLEAAPESTIHVTTAAAPGADPAGLAFVVALQWPEGRLLRRYAIERLDGALQPVSATDLRYGPTDTGDTLYSIAEVVRPEAVAVNQMMLALLAENPRSFNAENINALQRDVYLRIPPGPALQFPAAASANREVARQLRAWQGPGMPLRETATGAAADAATGAREQPSDEPDPPPAASSRVAQPLRLLPPAPALAAEAEREAGLDAASVAALQDELGRVAASNQRLSADNRALRRTMLDLRADVARLERLLERNRQSPATDRAAPASTSRSAPITAAMVADWLRGRLDWALANPRAALREAWVQITLGAFAVLLLLIVLAARGRRGRRRADRDDDATLPSHWRPQAGRPGLDEAAGETALGETSVRAAPAEPAEPLERASELIAYGQLERAQAVLDDALGEEPDSIELRVRLLDVLAMRGDRAGFESEAHVLRAQIEADDDPRWQAVARKGRALAPEHPLFGA